LEKFRVLDNPKINAFYTAQTEGSIEGSFRIPYGNKKLFVIAGCALDWDHVSVSLRHRTPTWAEMVWIKNLFFEPEELVIQFHPPQKQYINCAKHVLHIWRPWQQEIKLPPEWMLI
jgi:hypothetical protein